MTAVDSRPIIAYCASERSRAAIDWAAQEATRWMAPVIVVAALPSLWDWELAALQIDSDRVRAGIVRRLRGPWTQVLRDRGIRYQTRLLTGRPGPSVLELARDVDALCVVIAREGEGRLRELTGQGVGAYLHRYAKRPVMEIAA